MDNKFVAVCRAALESPLVEWSETDLEDCVLGSLTLYGNVQQISNSRWGHTG